MCIVVSINLYGASHSANQSISGASSARDPAGKRERERQRETERDRDRDTERERERAGRSRETERKNHLAHQFNKEERDVKGGGDAWFRSALPMISIVQWFVF